MDESSRSKAEWDAEIEADFQRVVAGTKTAGRRKRRQRLIGAPVAFIAEVCRTTTGRAALLVAMLIYRRTVVCNSRTVTLPGAELAELGVSRGRKHEALAQLVTAGIVRAERSQPGQTAKVKLRWKPI